MLLTHANLALAALASSDDGRANIEGVYLTPTETIATDGLCPRETLVPCLLPTAAAKALGKAIPKGRVAQRLPALAYARVDVAATNANGSIRAVTTDLEDAHTTDVTKGAEGFPSCLDDLMPPVDANPSRYVRVGISATLLTRVLETMIAMESERNSRVAFELWIDRRESEDKPILLRRRITGGQDSTFLVMPCRL